MLESEKIPKENRLWKSNYVIDGKREILTPKELNSQFVHSYASTVHGAQGSTYKHVLFYLKTGLQELNLFYVACSRPSRQLRVVIGYDPKPYFNFKLEYASTISEFYKDGPNPFTFAVCNACDAKVYSKTKMNKLSTFRNQPCLLCKLGTLCSKVVKL